MIQGLKTTFRVILDHTRPLLKYYFTPYSLIFGEKTLSALKIDENGQKSSFFGQKMTVFDNF